MKLIIIETPIEKCPGNIVYYCFKSIDDLPEVFWRGLGHESVEVTDKEGTEILKSQAAASELNAKLKNLYNAAKEKNT